MSEIVLIVIFLTSSLKRRSDVFPRQRRVRHNFIVVRLGLFFSICFYYQRFHYPNALSLYSFCSELILGTHFFKSRDMSKLLSGDSDNYTKVCSSPIYSNRIAASNDTMARFESGAAI